jgi:predicted RNA-binding Zn-ribbon protein involved in translation (DUF1610 family)
METNFDAKNRSAAILRYVRWQCVGFFVGAISLFCFFKFMGLFRGVLGGTPFLYLFLVGGFALFFLGPITLVVLLLQNDARLRCPKCGELLAVNNRALRQLYKTGACRNCGVRVPMVKPTRRQELTNIVIILGGFLLLFLIMLLTK